MNTFYLHIGLHKTGTTSLQADLFPNIPGIKYIGRYHENPVYGESLYNQIVKYAFNQFSPDSLKQKNINKEISHRLAKENLLLSEEWLTADYDLIYGTSSCRWQDKLYKLSLLLKDFPVKVLITTRAKEEAIYSMYCEMYQANQTKKYEGFFHFAMVDNSTIAYRTQYLEDLILILFGVQPHYIDLKDLSSEAYIYKLSCFFDTSISSSIKNRNVKIREEDGTYVLRDNFLYKVIRFFWLKIPLKIRASVKLRAFSKLRFLLRNSCSRKEVVPVPSEHEIKLLKFFFRNE